MRHRPKGCTPPRRHTFILWLFYLRCLLFPRTPLRLCADFCWGAAGGGVRCGAMLGPMWPCRRAPALLLAARCRSFRATTSLSLFFNLMLFLLFVSFFPAHSAVRAIAGHLRTTIARLRLCCCVASAARMLGYMCWTRYPLYPFISCLIHTALALSRYFNFHLNRIIPIIRTFSAVGARWWQVAERMEERQERKIQTCRLNGGEKKGTARLE